MDILVCPSIWKHLASSLETRRNKELIFFFYNLVFPGKIRKVFSQSLGWAGLGPVQCGQIINDYCLDSRHRPQTLDKETKHSYFLTSLYWARGVSLPGGKIKSVFNRKCSISVLCVMSWCTCHSNKHKCFKFKQIGPILHLTHRNWDAFSLYAFCEISKREIDPLPTRYMGHVLKVHI